MPRAMSKLIMAVAATALTVAIVPSNAVQARGLHIGIGGGPIGVVRSVASMIALRHAHGRHAARMRMANDRMAGEEAARSSQRADMTRSPDWIARPVARLQIAAGAAQPATLVWPADEIETRLHPNDTQRAALKALQDAAERAADTLKTACQPTDALTPTARLDAIAKRLGAMLAAVKSMRAALDDFYATLSDEQKAQFEAIGPRRTS